MVKKKIKIVQRLRILTKSPAVVFSLIAFSFGCLTIAFTPPFAGGDEEAHFIRAYGISNGQLVVNRYEEVQIPQSYRKTLGCIQTSKPVPGEIYKYDSTKYGNDKTNSFACAFSMRLDEQKTEGIYTTASSYSPTTFIPQTIAVWIGRALDLPIISMVYLMRALVMVSYIAMIVVAIRILPARKWALAGVALLPYSLLHFTNPGGDYMLYGAISIFLAVIIRSLYPGTAQSKDYYIKSIAILLLAGVMMVLPKGMIPGILFLPLLFFYGGLKKHIWQKVIIAVIIAAVALFWQKTVGSNAVETTDNISSSVLSFPLAFVKTMFYGWTSFDFFYNGSGGGGGARTPSVIVAIVNMMIAAYLFVKYDKNDDKILPRILNRRLFLWACIIIALMVVITSFAAIYIAASYLQNGSNIINGVQIRYYYPALFMLSIIPFARIFSTNKSSFKKIVVIGSCISLLATIAVILINYQWGIFGVIFD